MTKDPDRSKPTFILTNNTELSMQSILEVYAKRWMIENKLAELVAFFNLNAISSSLMIRMHFDILWSMIADTLYHRFVIDLQRFENNLAPTVFRKFIDILISKLFSAIIQKQFCPSITATKLWFVIMLKTKPVLVYTRQS